MFVVDTNVLIYAVNPKCSEHARCRALLEQASRESLRLFLTWGIIYEFLRVTTHPEVFETPLGIEDAWHFASALLACPATGILRETERHSEVAEQVWKEIPLVRGNLVHDAHTAVLMREHGIRRIYTRDTDFHRFPFLEVIDPLSNS